MTTIPNESVYPIESKPPYTTGLTKREYFAACALQGLSVQAIPGSHNTPQAMCDELPQTAVMLADRLIIELNKVKA